MKKPQFHEQLHPDSLNLNIVGHSNLLIAVMHVLCNPDFTYLNISHIREGVGPI